MDKLHKVLCNIRVMGFDVKQSSWTTRNARIRLFKKSFGEFSRSDIIGALQLEAENYVRKIHRLPDTAICETYKTEDGRIAVLEINSPKKRLLYRHCCDWRTPDEEILAFRRKYGFIPRPINVLRHYVDIGAVKSEDVEHIYHSEPVDWEISDDLKTFETAYALDFNEKDIVADGFNGFSCMSEGFGVGTFYYYFGAYMLIFYKKGTNDIVGRMVLWKTDDGKYHYLKGYVRTRYQVKAREVVSELEKEGKFVRGLPSDYKTHLCRMDGKTPKEIYEKICHKAIVPYIDEDLMLSGDKTTLRNDKGSYSCKSTGMAPLDEYGINICDECGSEIDEDDIIWVDGTPYCDECALYCDCCDTWYAPGEDGDEAGGRWVCRSCLDEDFFWCESCERFVPKDERCEYMDTDGFTNECCEDCLESYCTDCDDCGKWFSDKLKDPEYPHLCPDCIKKIKTEGDNNESK